MKEEKINLLITEALDFVPKFRKDFVKSQPPQTEGLRLSPHQFFCLNLIDKCGQTSMSELSKKMGVSNQQITRIVDYLVQNNYAERFTDPLNRRLVQAKISETGKVMLFKFKEAQKLKMAQSLTVLTEKEIDDCITHMQALKIILSKVNF